MRNRYPFLITKILFFIGVAIQSEPLMAGFSWKSIPAFPPNGRYGPTEFVIGTKAYVGFGIITGVTYMSDMWEYDQLTNLWTQKASIPTAGKFSPRSFVINGKGYVMTGWTPLQTDDLWEYDPIGNTWTQKLSFPGGARYTGIAISIAGKGYFGTGYAPLYKDWWEYDPIGNSWTQKADVPGSVRQSAVAFEINGLGYAGMGSNAPTFGTDFNDFHAYDPVLNTWTTLPNFPGGVRFGCEEFVLCGKGYVGLGQNSSGTIYDDFYKFDPITNSWSFVGVFPGGPLSAGTGFSIGNKGYAGLGSDGTTAYLSAIWEYSVDPDSFSYTVSPCGNSVNFNAIPGNSTSYLWDFGDSTNSINQNPTHYYSLNGTYNVSLITTNECITDTFTKQITISAGSIATAAFSYTIDTCAKSINFSNNSINATSWSWNFGDTSFSTIQNPSHQYNNIGNYLVTLIVYNPCDTDSIQLNINLPATVNANSLFTFTIDTCTGIVAFNNLSTNASGYLWNFDDGDSSSQTSPSHQYANAGNYNVSLISNDYCGGDTLIVPLSLSISPQAQADFNFTLDTCSYQLNFVNQSTNSSSYQWYFGDNDSSILQNPSHQFADSGNYNVILYSANDCGIDSMMQNIYIPGILQANANFQITLDTCNKTVSLNNQSISSNLYFWSFGDGDSSLSVNPVHIYQDTGTYQISLTASNSCNDDSITLSVYIPEIPSAQSLFSFTADTCTGIVTFSNQSTNSSGYLWHFGDGDSSIQSNPVHQYSSSGNYNVSLIADGYCERDTLVVPVSLTLSPQSQALFSFTLDTCTFQLNFSNQSINSTSYQWYFGDGDSSNLTSPSHQYADSGNYIVTLFSANNCGMDTIVQNIFIPGIPQANANFQVTIDSCLKTVTFNNQSLSSATYFWNFGDGDSSLAVNPVHIYQDTGTYQVNLLASNSCNTNNVILSIHIPFIPEATSAFTFSIDTCSQTITFNNQSINANSYFWNFGDSTNTVNTNPVHQFLLPGVYPVSLIAFDNCKSDTIIQSINVPNSTFPVSMFSVLIDSCTYTATFTNSSQNGNSTLWTFGDTNQDTSSNPTHVYADTGNYTVSLITTNPCGSDTISIPLHITKPAAPVPAFAYSLDSCSGSLTFLNNSSNASSFSWSFGNGDTSNLVSPTVIYVDSGNYQVTLTSYGKCTMDSIQVNLFIPLPPVIISDFSVLVDSCSNSVSFINESTNAAIYQWYFMDGDSSIQSSPVHTFNLAGSYPVQLIATNTAGCKDSFTLSIELPNDTFGNIFIPNCFTPNGDNFNETFKISSFNECLNYTLQIYNRWGEMIFETKDLNKEWDGTFNSVNVPDGVYYYLFNGNNISKTGSISVFR